MKQGLLIVEDDEATAAFLSDNLAADGFAVACATGAAEAIRAVEVRSPALILLDLDARRRQRARRARPRPRRGRDRLADRPDVPVIVITGRSGEADRVRGFMRGADDYVVKPFSYGELLGGSARCCAARRGARSAG